MVGRGLHRLAVVIVVGLVLSLRTGTVADAQCAPDGQWSFPFGCWEEWDGCCFTASCFTPNGMDVGGIAVACLPLNSQVPPDSSWGFSITVPEMGGQCEDSRESLARVGVMLCGEGVSCDPSVPQMEQDYIVLDFDPNRTALGLVHFDHGTYNHIFNSDYDDVLPDPLTGAHEYRITRTADGMWSLWIDNVLRGTRSYADLPDVPGHMELINVYCSGAAFCLLPKLVLHATFDLDPNPINLKSKGKWVTGYIELPDGYDPTSIDVSTVMLNDALPAALSPTAVGDHDADGIPDRMVKFGRKGTISLLTDNGSRLWLAEGRNDNAPLNDGQQFGVTVTGQLGDGTGFEGADAIAVMNPGKVSGSNQALSVHLSTPGEPGRVEYRVDAGGPVALRVYDVAGRLLRTLVDRNEAAGLHEVRWDLMTDSGRRVGAGVYFVRFDQGTRVTARKLVIVQ